MKLIVQFLILLATIGAGFAQTNLGVAPYEWDAESDRRLGEATELLSREDYQRGVERLKQSVDLAEKAYGTNDAMIRIPLHKLALAYLRIGKHDDALAASIRCLMVAESAFDPENPAICDALNLVAATSIGNSPSDC